jgi:hypothetical protein
MQFFSQTCVINTFYVNALTAYVPQLWANESLMILQENMVAASLVHRDFSTVVAEYGDTVNKRRPAKFIAIRKTADDSVTDQDAVATNVPVVLNQLAHVTFVIKDAQASLAFKDLVNEFLRPAMLAQAKFVDQVILSQYTQFLANQYGQINGLTSSTTRQYMLGVRQLMNQNLAPEDGRNLLLSSASETTMLNTDLFTQAQQVGDNGNALRNAQLGTKLGFNNFMSQNVPNVSTAATNQVAGTGVTITAIQPIGAVTVGVSGLTAAIPAGSWCLIDSRPYRVVSSTGGATPTAITISAPGFLAAVAISSPVVCYASTVTVQSNLDSSTSAGYPSGYVKQVQFTAQANPPTPGQLVTFGTSATSATYAVVQYDATNGAVTLDRPLEASVALSATVNFGPGGQFNLAFRENAIALVSRPLALPPEGLGARAAVVNYNNVSMRALISYDGVKQGVRVTLDMLFGVKVLDANLGAVLLG